MKKARIMEGVMALRFEEISGRFYKGKLTTEEAAELLGVSVRTFLRKRCRGEEEDFDGVYDRRLGRVSGRRASDRVTQEMCQLYRERYRGFSVKHFHEFACREHGLTYGYTWMKTRLECAGLVRKSKRGGDHRLRRVNLLQFSGHDEQSQRR